MMQLKSIFAALLPRYEFELVDPSETYQDDFSAMVPMQVFNSLDQLSRIRTLIVGGGQMSDVLIALVWVWLI